MQAKEAIAPSFCLNTITTGIAEAFWGSAVRFFLKCCRTVSGMAGICKGRCCIVGSVLWVGLGQQRQPFLPQNELILVSSGMHWERWEVFSGSTNAMFSHTLGCKSQDVINTQADREQPATEVWKDCFMQEAFGFGFKRLIHVSFGDYCAICSDTLWSWSSSSSLLPQKTELCCDCPAACSH